VRVADGMAVAFEGAAVGRGHLFHDVVGQAFFVVTNRFDGRRIQDRRGKVSLIGQAGILQIFVLKTIVDVS
jgi:hypothetical protein